MSPIRKFSHHLDNKGIHGVLLLCAYLGLFYLGLTDNGRGPAYPLLLEDLNLDNRQGSLLFATTSFIGFLLNSTAPLWLKNWKSFYGLKMGLIFLCFATFFLGLSGTLLTPWPLFLSSFLQGVGMGMTGICMNLMVQEASPHFYRRQAYGGLHATYGISSFFAPVLLSIFLGSKIKWEYFFYFLSFIGLLIFIFIPTPKEKVLEKTNIENFVRPKLPITFLLIMAMAIGLYVSTEIVISSRLVLYLEKAMGLDKILAGNFLSAFFILLMLGRLSLSLFKINISNDKLLLSSLFFSTLLIFIGLKGFSFCFPLCGLSMSIFFPTFMDWMAEKFPHDFKKVTSIVSGGIGLHLTIMHLSFGEVAKNLGVSKAMNISFLLIMTSFFLTAVFIFWEKRNHQKFSKL